MHKSKRKQTAQETLAIAKQGWFTNSFGARIDIQSAQQYAEQNTKLYTPHQTDELIDQIDRRENTRQIQFQVTEESTLEATIRLIREGCEDVALLNFASAKNPGGGFLGGAQAQEESLARSMGLYPCLLKGKGYYTFHRQQGSCLYSDHMIYSPKVPIIKNDEGEMMGGLLTASVVTSAAVNTGVVTKRGSKKVPEIEGIMRTRIKKVLAIMSQHKHKHLVLGAWGCGVFQNDPNDIAKYFKEVIDDDFRHCFETIVFAIYSSNKRFIIPFQALFGN